MKDLVKQIHEIAKFLEPTTVRGDLIIDLHDIADVLEAKYESIYK